MKNGRWIIYGLALAMIAGTAAWLEDLRSRDLLGPAGVRVEPVPIYDTQTNLVAKQSVVLPGIVMGIPSRPGLVDTTEVLTLPRDTTYGLRYYHALDSDFFVQLSVILMGTDHTSIHQPQYCLYAQDWTITKEERIQVRMNRPLPYDVPAVKLTATRQLRSTGQMVNCLYVYWFVSGDKITAEEGSRLWSMWKTMLQKGKMERWAYISYFVTCVPGAEQATFDRLEKFIQASAPEFQTVTGQPSGPLQSSADVK